MSGQPRLPWPARWLFAWSPVPRHSRAEVESDLLELFGKRRAERGLMHAYWRLVHDLFSLWRPGSALLHDVRGDLTHAVRLFRRQPGILALAIAGLSLGLGISTAAFGIMNAALRGEGVVDPDRAPGVLRATERSTFTAWKYEEFVRLREGATRMQVEAVLTDAAAVRMNASDAAGPSAGIGFVSGGFFGATGGRTSLGRPLQLADESHAGPPPVVVSHVFWTSRLNSDRNVVGRTIRVGRTAAVVVGVADRGFSVPHRRQVWMPLTAYGAVYDSAPAKRTPDMAVQVFGRLVPDASLSEAESQLSGVAAGLPRDAAAGDSTLRARLDTNAGLARMASSETLAITAIVSVVIGLVIVLSCANVASVLISTAIARDREMGVRAALGASRWRIVRQLLTESLGLGAVAAAIGLLLSYWAMPAIGRMIDAPAGLDLAPDLNVYVFLTFVTLVTGVGAGLAPAFHSRGADLVSPLKGQSPRPNRVAPRRLRSVLVMTQAAGSVLLIVLAALFARASVRAAAIDVGFDPNGLYAVSVGLGRQAFDNEGAGVRSFFARAVPELQALPGITAVTLAELTPFGNATRTSITREQPSKEIHFNRTRAGYVETMGLRTLTGRTYTPAEVTAKAPVAMVSQSLARAYWQEQSPIGQRLPDAIPLIAGAARPVVIGVVGDTVTARLHEANAYAVYEPLDPASEVFADLVIRVDPEMRGVTEQVTERLRLVDAQADVRVASIAARVDEEANRPRMFAALTGVIGLIAIVLCVIGLYGLTASVLGQRAREMGVRIAMGAAPWDLLRLLMWESLKPVAVGLVLGTGAALLVSRLVVATMFFGISPQDPIALAGAVAILLLATMLAVLAPTRRAAAVDAAVELKRS